MAWTAPRTWVAGEIVTASIMNSAVRDNLRYIKGLDGVPTIESGLTIDNTDGDERLLLPLLSTAECTSVLNAEGEVAFDEQLHSIKYYNGTELLEIASKAFNPLPIRKTADETINNDNTLQNDDHLLFSIAANEEWVFHIVVYISAVNAAADFQAAITIPAAATMKFGESTVDFDTALAANEGAFVTSSGSALASGCSTACMKHYYGWVLNSTNAGTVQFQWAQVTANVSNLTVGQGSHLIRHRIV